MTSPLLSIRGLSVRFRASRRIVPAVNDLSFDVYPGETLGIVGESGCGKSVTALSLLGLLPVRPAAGKALFRGRDLFNLGEREWRSVRGREIAIVFQDPMTSLNPYLRVSTQIEEVTRRRLGHSAKQACDHAIAMLELAGIPDARFRSRCYPHELSGGMRQRVMIAMALACRPALLIADEPTSSLDVTVQAHILGLLFRLRESGGSQILISHDLSVVAGSADRILVMYRGYLMESAPTDDLFASPWNPYTRALLRSIPDWNRPGARLFQLPGSVAESNGVQANSCPFAGRCPEAIAKCSTEDPPLQTAPGGRISRCWLS